MRRENFKKRRKKITELNNTGNTNMELMQECPYFTLPHMAFKFGQMAFGTLGLIFLNVWIALVYLIYSIVFNFLIMPLVMCKYCYYKLKETTIDNGKTVREKLPLDQWKESYLEKFVGCAKKWSFNFFIIWFFPIIGIVISFFLSFSIFALLSLISLIVVLAVMMNYTQRKDCSRCAIRNECHSSFGNK